MSAHVLWSVNFRQFSHLHPSSHAWECYDCANVNWVQIRVLRWITGMIPSNVLCIYEGSISFKIPENFKNRVKNWWLGPTYYQMYRRWRLYNYFYYTYYIVWARNSWFLFYWLKYYPFRLTYFDSPYFRGGFIGSAGNVYIASCITTMIVAKRGRCSRRYSRRWSIHWT